MPSSGVQASVQTENCIPNKYINLKKKNKVIGKDRMKIWGVKVKSGGKKLLNKACHQNLEHMVIRIKENTLRDINYMSV